MRNLNNIFKTNNRQAQRAILDKFDISREDKNKTLNELNNSNGGGGSVSKYAPRYYKFAEDTIEDAIAFAAQFSSTIKAIIYGDITIMPSIIGFSIPTNGKKYIGFSFIPFYTELNNTEQFIYNFDELVNVVSDGNEEGINLIKQYITEITEDEYYKID